MCVHEGQTLNNYHSFSLMCFFFLSSFLFIFSYHLGTFNGHAAAATVGKKNDLLSLAISTKPIGFNIGEEIIG